MRLLIKPFVERSSLDTMSGKKTVVYLSEDRLEVLVDFVKLIKYDLFYKDEFDMTQERSEDVEAVQKVELVMDKTAIKGLYRSSEIVPQLIDGETVVDTKYSIVIESDSGSTHIDTDIEEDQIKVFNAIYKWKYGKDSKTLSELEEERRINKLNNKKEDNNDQ